MKPAAFDYARPGTVKEAIAALAGAAGDGKALAGGQSLVPLMNLRLARPALLVDLAGIDELTRITREGDGTLVVGAMVHHVRLATDPAVVESAPLLAEAARWIGHSAIRARGTIGGSLAHADPAAELPAVTTALGAELMVAGPSGERAVPAAGFFTGPLSTVLDDDEILVGVRVPPAPPGRVTGFVELARRHGDFALVLAAVVIDGGQARLVVGGAGPSPLLVTGAATSPAEVAALARQAADECRPSDDVHAPATYRRHLVATLAAQALARGTTP